jgi:hypothetical protein
LIIGLPLFLFGIVHNILQYKLTDKLVPKLTKDIEYYAPLSVLLGLILYPISYLSFMFLLKYTFELNFWQQISYFALMPITGLLAYSIHAYYRHIAIKWRFMTFLMRRKDLVQDLKKQKEQLRTLVFGS